MSINIEYDLNHKHYEENYEDMFIAESRFDWLEQVEKAKNIELYTTSESCFRFPSNLEQNSGAMPF